MKRSHLLRLVCVVALALMPMLAHGAPAKKKATTRAKTSTAARPAKQAAKAASTEAPVRTAAPRRLEDIRIEGEVPVPQVLFITARDQRRFLGSHHDLYLRTSKELGEMTPLPARVVLTPATAAPATKDAR